MDESFAHWLAGFIDGEGCFMLRKSQHRRTPRFVVAVRGDDEPVLRLIQEQLGAGIIEQRPARRNAAPSAALVIDGREACRKLEAALMLAPLRAKKRREFELWQRSLDLWDQVRIGRGVDNSAIWRQLGTLGEELSAAKRYLPGE